MIFTLVQIDRRKNGILEILYTWKTVDHALFSHYVETNENTIVVSY